MTVVKKKLLIGGCVVVVLAAIIGFSLNARRKDLTEVEAGKVSRQDELIAIVSATGEIKPKEYVELQAEISGVITELYVKEGDFVEKSGILLKIDPIQTQSETRAQEALLRVAESEARNQQAQISVQESNSERDRASVRVSEVELENARQNMQLAQSVFDRKQGLYEDNLISKDAYDAVKNDLVNSESAYATAQVRLQQAKAQLRVSEVVLEQARTSYQGSLSRVEQQRAIVTRNHDLLSKTVIRSPLTGVITQLNVEAGERAVPGTLNNPSATLMVIADLSIIEAEVEVDETDIVDVKLGQLAEVNVDAIPDQPLKGSVTEIGNSAIVKAGQEQEAKDFKVVIQLDEPPASLRPGLSCTGEITTATRTDVLSVPIQALTVREFSVDESGAIVREESDSNGKGNGDGEEEQSEKEEFEGVFKIVDAKAEFTPVETGIVSESQIEILSGLEEGVEIVTGSYKTLRTLKDGDRIKKAG
jgi:HlyD family secretion protein